MDVVDMTGDHFIDATNENVLFTLQMYKLRGWGYYAAGATIEEARKPLLLDNHGNKIAFEGCNAKPKGYSGATETLAGTWHCDWSYLDNELPSIVQSGYLPIMTFSHLEYYKYIAVPALIQDFHHAADDGAVIVSGSQAHQPQAMEFYKNSFLHYGLGNLFFDQYNEWPDSRKAFIDRHVFYDGKYINTELITIMFINNAQSRLMTNKERDDLLTTVFDASGWKVNP
jgi:poly-gamma-glutamate synthesis protein (capsule biosynthesis protein)